MFFLDDSFNPKIYFFIKITTKKCHANYMYSKWHSKDDFVLISYWWGNWSFSCICKYENNDCLPCFFLTFLIPTNVCLPSLFSFFLLISSKMFGPRCIKICNSSLSGQELRIPITNKDYFHLQKRTTLSSSKRVSIMLFHSPINTHW